MPDILVAMMQESQRLAMTVLLENPHEGARESMLAMLQRLGGSSIERHKNVLSMLLTRWGIDEYGIAWHSREWCGLVLSSTESQLVFLLL